MNQLRLLILLCWISVAQAQAPTGYVGDVPPDPAPNVFAALSTTNPSPRLGEPFQLTLTVRTPPALPIVEWPTLDTLEPPLEILAVQPRLLSQRATEYVYTQAFEAVLWSTGLYLTPVLRVVYEREGRRFFVPVQSVSLQVAPQIVEPFSTSPRPSLPSVDLPLPAGWALLPAAIVAAFSLWLARSRRRVQTTTVVSSHSAQSIIAQLEDLQHSNLQPEEVILSCVERVRAYLAQALSLNAQELTSSEILAQLRAQQLLPKSLISGLGTLLEQADLIKFANLSPQVSPQQFVRTTIRWIKLADQAASGLYG